MNKTAYRLPSSKSLLALEATVRLGSATRAARELLVTQTAISHRLKDLEDQLGKPLFCRHGRTLVPTAEALSLAEAVRSSACILNTAWNSIQSPAERDTLTISMLPALASKWLALRLSDMLGEVRSANLRISASRELVDFRCDGIDAAIRYGVGNWPAVRARHIADEFVAPVMAPSLARQIDPASPQALSGVTLLCCDNPDSWDDWFAASGHERPRDPAEIHFDEDATMLESAIGGTGVALGRFALTAHDLRTGRLVAPFSCRMTSRYSYWFVQDHSAPERRSTEEFFTWARKCLSRDAQMQADAVQPGKP
ncbi:LysR substrate-binding domain-containing protein [Cribrihabitans neustonicus]|uniref:LysR substrate-binding domain-containing protein n=1 Tax=Cribrihabitans neustonicus TaxID=1429085 RepID=UPI003B59083D